MDEVRILSPTAILGYGFPESSFEEGLSRNPHVIAVDAGSSDPGPYYLGAGVSFTDRAAVKRDSQIILRAGVTRGIPVIIGSAGGAGARSHLHWARISHWHENARNRIRNSFGYGAVCAARKRSIEIQTVDRRITTPCLHSRWIELGQNDYPSAGLGFWQPLNKPSSD